MYSIIGSAMSNDEEIVDELLDELDTGTSAETPSSKTTESIEEDEQMESFSKTEIAEVAEGKLEGWSLHVERNDLYVWVHDYEKDIVVIESPEGYEWWNIYDSTNECVEGVSCGPYDTLEAAIEELNEDLSGSK